MPVWWLLVASAVAAPESEVPFTIDGEVVVASDERVVPLPGGTRIDAGSFSVELVLRRSVQVRLGVTITGTSRLTWDADGFHHAVRDVVSEGRVDVVGGFSLDVAISQGGVPLTSATIASDPAVARSSATLPRPLLPPDVLELDADDLDVEAAWGPRDAGLIFAAQVGQDTPVVDPVPATATATGSLSGVSLSVEHAGAPIDETFAADVDTSVGVSLGWTGAGTAGGSFDWTGGLYGRFDVVSQGEITLIVPLDELDGVSFDEAAADLVTTAVDVVHPVPRVGLSDDPIDLGATGVDIPLLTEVELPALGTEPLHAALHVEGEAMQVSTALIDARPGTPARFQIGFRPLHEGGFDGTLTITTDDPWTPVLTIPLHGVGASSGPGPGCACSTGSTGSTGSTAAAGLLLLALLRRRR